MASLPEDATTSNGSYVEMLQSSVLDEALSSAPGEPPGFAQGTPSRASSGCKKRRKQALFDAVAMHSCPAHDVSSALGDDSTNTPDPCSEAYGRGHSKRPRLGESHPPILSGGLMEERNPGPGGPTCPGAEKPSCGKQGILELERSPPRIRECASPVSPDRTAPRLAASAWTVAGLTKKMLPSGFLSPRRSSHQGDEGLGVRLGHVIEGCVMGSPIREDPGCSAANQGVFCVTNDCGWLQMLLHRSFP